MSAAFSTTSAASASIPLPPTTQVRGLRLLLAWTAWVILTALSLIGFITSIAAYLAVAQRPCQPSVCVEGLPSIETARTLQQWGLPFGALVALNVGLVIAAGIEYCAVATIIAWRKPHDWMALLVSSTLITQGLFETNYLQGTLNDPASPWYWAGLWLAYISPVQVLVFCALFPNGRFVSRWIGWLLAALCLADLLPSLFPAMPLSGMAQGFFSLSGFPLVAGTMIYRYRRISTAIEREQTKWVVFGVTLTILAFLAWLIPQIILFSTLSHPGSLYDVVGHPLFLIASGILPICIGIAVLRHRLWDIEVIINKALVYGALTAMLAAVYAGLILLLEAILGRISTQSGEQPVVLVVSTLVVVALTGPLRQRTQSAIDRRFYRRKFDTAKTIAAFGATLRTETNLTRLTEHLVDVVAHTMQPEHVSLWLREPATPRPHTPRDKGMFTSRS